MLARMAPIINDDDWWIVRGPHLQRMRRRIARADEAHKLIEQCRDIIERRPDALDEIDTALLRADELTRE